MFESKISIFSRYCDPMWWFLVSEDGLPFDGDLVFAADQCVNFCGAGGGGGETVNPDCS
jgi:hypothetical protein